MVNLPQSYRLRRAVLAIVAAGGFATEVRASSLAEAWGFDPFYGGQLGNGTTTSSTTPVAVTGMSSGMTAVSAGQDQSLAVQNGVVYAWGWNVAGQLGNGTTSNSSTPVAVTGLSSGVTAVAGGQQNSLAVQNGAVYAWGQNNDGQLGNGTTINSTTPVAVTGLSSGVTAVAAGATHCLAVQNGAVYAWGQNYYGELGNGTTSNSSTPVAVTGLSSDVTAIAGGAYHSLAVQNGAAYAWGNNGQGELGNGTATNGSTTPVAVTGLSSGVTAVAGGSFYSLALRNGAVYAWGFDNFGQLGNGTTGNGSTTPLAVAGITGTVSAISASANSSYALAADGSIWDWGYNGNGELGLGTTTFQYTTPQHLLAPAGYAFTSVSAGGNHVVAILSRPDAAIAASATGTVLGTVATQMLVLSGPKISGSVQVNPGQSNTVHLTLDTPSQAGALIADLNNVYGAGTASADTGAYQVALTLPSSAGSLGYFNFDFTTVVGAGPVDALNPAENDVGSVAIDDLAFTASPEPASLGLLATAVAGGLLGRRRRWTSSR